MRTLLATIALFLLTPTLRAQELPCSFGKEAPRCEVVVYPTEAEATARMFDLLLGENAQGRKEHIAEHGHEYLDLADIS